MREQWIKSVPNANLNVTNNTVICQQHWPSKFDTMLRIYKNLHFEIFHYEVKCYISSLSKNHINTVDTWSKLEEIIRYLNSMAFDHKKNILSQQFLAMTPKIVGIKYGSDIVIHAFGYYATSQTLYNKLRDDFQLPSLATLGRIVT